MARWTVRSKASPRPSSNDPSTTTIPPAGSATYPARLARSVVASHNAGSTRPVPSGASGSSTSRASPPTSSQSDHSASGSVRPCSNRSDAGRRKSPARTRSTGRPRSRSGSTNASASAPGRVGGAPSSATRSQWPGSVNLSIVSASSATTPSTVIGRTGTPPILPGASAESLIRRITRVSTIGGTTVSIRGGLVMSEAGSVRALADELVAVLKEQEPLMATMYGIDGDHDRLADLSEAADRTYRDRFTDLIERATAIDPAGLAADDRITRAVVIQQARARIDSIDSGLVEYTITDLFVAPAAVLLTGLPLLGLPTAELADAFVRRLGEIPAHLEGAAARHRAGIAAGRVPVAHLVEAAIKHIDRYLADPE